MNDFFQHIDQPNLNKYQWIFIACTLLLSLIQLVQKTMAFIFLSAAYFVILYGSFLVNTLIVGLPNPVAYVIALVLSWVLLAMWVYQQVIKTYIKQIKLNIHTFVLKQQKQKRVAHLMYLYKKGLLPLNYPLEHQPLKNNEHQN